MWCFGGCKEAEDVDVRFGVLAAGVGWDARFTAVFAAAALMSFLGPATYDGFTAVLICGGDSLAF